MATYLREVVSTTFSAVSAVGSFYTDINPSTLSGAIDIIVVQQPNGLLACSPFHVRFGKLKILHSREKLVELLVNGEKSSISMKMGDAGEAFFVVESLNPIPKEYATSPLQYPASSVDDVDSFYLDEDLLKASPGKSTNAQSKSPPKNNSSPSKKISNEELAAQSSNLVPEWSKEISSDSSKGNPIDIPNSRERSVDSSPQKPLPGSPPGALTWNWGGLPEQNKKEGRIGDIENARGVSPSPPSTSFAAEISKQPIETSLDSTALPLTEINPLPAQSEGELDAIDDSKVEISLCGPLHDLENLTPEAALSRFKKYLVNYEDLNLDPILLMDPLTVYKFGGFYHTWSTAAPSILSFVCFGKPLSEKALHIIIDGQHKPQGYSFIKGWWSSSAPRPTASLPLPRRGLSPSRSLSMSPSLKEKQPQNSKLPSYSKSLRMTSDQLKSLNLKKGMNHIEFSIFSSLQGKQSCSAKIFLWDYNTKVVISDVDGTITKSDVLGHVYTMMGKDWTQDGVAKLYAEISKNGYEFIYLSSRAIGQASTTREYLKKIEQNSKQLPEGPLLVSPDRLAMAFTREVIQREPEKFKIPCLKDIAKLFAPAQNPFYAGFGNRPTDSASYRAVGVPNSRIFIVDSKGHLKSDLLALNYKSSYSQLCENVDLIFPPKEALGEYHDFQYWAPKHPPINLDENSSQNGDEDDDGSGSFYSDEDG